MEESGGTVGKYTMANRKDNRIERLAKQLAIGLKVRLACAAHAKETIVAPVRTIVETDCMEWEDALSTAARQDIRARRKRLAKVSLKNLLEKRSFASRVRKSFSGIASKAKSALSFLLYDPERWIHRRLQKPPLNQMKHMLRIFNKAEVCVDRGDEEACFFNQHYPEACVKAYDEVDKLSRSFSWVTGAAVRINKMTGKHMNLEAPNKEHTNRAKSLMRQLAGVVEASEVGSSSAVAGALEEQPGMSSGSHSLKVLNQNLGSSSAFEQRAIHALSQWPKIPEAWVCGGSSDGVVCVMRVIDQEELVPRGGPVAEITAGSGSAQLRAGFQAKRPLCDDDMHQFATYASAKGGRLLCATANRRLRQCEPLASELTPLDAYWGTVLFTIYESRHHYSEARETIAVIQGMLRIRRARARTQFLKDAIQQRLLHKALGVYTSDSDGGNEDGDVDNVDLGDLIDTPAAPLMKQKTMRTFQKQLGGAHLPGSG